jgi:hypothetical protein
LAAQSLAVLTDRSAIVGAVPDKARLGFSLPVKHTYTHSLAALKSPGALMPRRAIPGPAFNTATTRTHTGEGGSTGGKRKSQLVVHDVNASCSAANGSE